MPDFTYLDLKNLLNTKKEEELTHPVRVYMGFGLYENIQSLEVAEEGGDHSNYMNNGEFYLKIED